MGGSSGGSSAGQVSYPAYMETIHSDWLDEINILIAAATNPFTSATAYDPDADLAANANMISLYNNMVLAFDPDSDWGNLWTIAASKIDARTLPGISVLSAVEITAAVNVFKANILARFNQDILPIYQRGMQNVRAVMTSAYTIGEALLLTDYQRDIDKFEADLNLKNDETRVQNEIITQENEMKKINFISHGTDEMLIAMGKQLDSFNVLTATTIESNRIKIVSKFEENEINVKYEEKEELWDFELYVFAGNLLASISGAASATTGKSVSTGASVLGGAMSGAAAGAAISGGNPLGAGIGAVLGGIGGLL